MPLLSLFLLLYTRPKQVLANGKSGEARTISEPSLHYTTTIYTHRVDSLYIYVIYVQRARAIRTRSKVVKFALMPRGIESVCKYTRLNGTNRARNSARVPHALSLPVGKNKQPPRPLLIALSLPQLNAKTPLCDGAMGITTINSPRLSSPPRP